MTRHFYWLDWIRFIAALMVMVCHARTLNWAEWGQLDPAAHSAGVEIFFTLTRAAQEWVVVFFVLSGFLVGGKAIERTIAGTFDVRAYALDRVTRIWVPLLPALVFTGLIFYWCGNSISIAEFLGNVFALQGVCCGDFGHNDPLWSLSYEVWFYLLAGFGGLIVSQRNQRFWPLLGLAVCFAIFTKLRPVFLCCWLLGAFCYLLKTGKGTIGVGPLGAFLALVGTGLSQMLAATHSVTLGAAMDWMPSRDVATLVESVGVGLLFADLSHRAPATAGLAKLERAGAPLAAFSYTLYLTHYALQHLWSWFLPELYPKVDLVSFLVFLGRVFSSLLMAWILYLCFESRTPAVRKWLKIRPPFRSLAPAAQA